MKLPPPRIAIGTSEEQPKRRSPSRDVCYRDFARNPRPTPGECTMEGSLPQLILSIKLERSSERLTSLGGLVVLEELARAVGLWEEVDRVLEGPKSGRGYQPHEFVQGLVWMLHAGGGGGEDLRGWRGEQEVLGALGLEALPAAGTVGDWLRRQGGEGAGGVQRIRRQLIR